VSSLRRNLQSPRDRHWFALVFDVYDSLLRYRLIEVLNIAVIPGISASRMGLVGLYLHGMDLSTMKSSVQHRAIIDLPSLCDGRSGGRSV
jgi:hypothetical protein